MKQRAETAPGRDTWCRTSPRARIATGVGALLASLAVLSGCKGKSDAKPIASGVPAPIASGVPISPERISKAVNPKGEQAYSGPTGSVRGIIRVTGDKAPEQPDVLAQIPSGCDRAKEVYGALFREGPGRTLGDALVAVTGYKGYVPSRRQVFTVEAQGCAWSTRTVALTFGERLEVVAKDRRAYVPDLLGARVPVQLLALPGGSGSAMYPEAPGRYVLVDSMRIYARAEVLVLKYSTFDVTGLDGKYSIEGIPAGPVSINALLPSTMSTVQRDIVIEEGKTLDLDLEVSFDAAAFKARLDAAGQGAPKPPASSAP